MVSRRAGKKALSHCGPVPNIIDSKKQVAGLLAETEALRKQIRRLSVENQHLRSQLAKASGPTNSLAEAKRVLTVIEAEEQLLVKAIARQLRFPPTKVERLLEDLEFEGYVQSRLSVNGTFYRPRGQGEIRQCTSP